MAVRKNGNYAFLVIRVCLHLAKYNNDNNNNNNNNNVLACLTTDHKVAGSILGTSTNFNCELGLERSLPSVRTIG